MAVADKIEDTSQDDMVEMPLPLPDGDEHFNFGIVGFGNIRVAVVGRNDVEIDKPTLVVPGEYKELLAYDKGLMVMGPPTASVTLLIPTVVAHRFNLDLSVMRAGTDGNITLTGNPKARLRGHSVVTPAAKVSGSYVCLTGGDVQVPNDSTGNPAGRGSMILEHVVTASPMMIQAHDGTLRLTFDEAPKGLKIISPENGGSVEVARDLGPGGRVCERFQYKVRVSDHAPQMLDAGLTSLAASRTI